MPEIYASTSSRTERKFPAPIRTTRLPPHTRRGPIMRISLALKIRLHIHSSLFVFGLKVEKLNYPFGITPFSFGFLFLKSFYKLVAEIDAFAAKPLFWSAYAIKRLQNTKTSKSINERGRKRKCCQLFSRSIKLSRMSGEETMRGSREITFFDGFFFSQKSKKKWHDFGKFYAPKVRSTFLGDSSDVRRITLFRGRLCRRKRWWKFHNFDYIRGMFTRYRKRLYDAIDWLLNLKNVILITVSGRLVHSKIEQLVLVFGPNVLN